LENEHAIENEAKSFQAEEHAIKAFDDLDDRIIEKLKDTSLYPELEWDATVRNNNDLSKEEIKFIHDRKLFIREAFAKYMGVDVSEIHVDDIPVIAFIGSGGGYRAMISFTAVQESGLYDCGVYSAVLSGSCWGMGRLYTTVAQSHENPIQASLEFYRTELEHSLINAYGILKGFAETSDPQTAVELTFGSLIRKKATGMKLSILDVFSALLAAKLMIGEDPTKQFGDFKLSEQRKYIDGGKNLMPLYVSIFHIRPWKEDALKSEEAALFPNYEEMFEKHKMKKDYYRWYEFNPYEIGNEENPENLNLEKMLNDFLNKVLACYLALSASLKAIVEEIPKFLPDGKFKDELKDLYDEAMEKIGTQNQQVFEGHHPIPQPNDYNFSYHLHPPPPYKLGPDNNEIFHFGDAGPSNDLPMYPISHPKRKIDVVIGFDCSPSIVDHKIFDEKQDVFCNRRGLNRITRDVTNKYCEVYDFVPTGKTNDEFLPPAQKQFVLCYMQYLQNDKVDPSFVPAKALFTNILNFSYNTDQVDLMIKLAKANWLESEKQFSFLGNIMKAFDDLDDRVIEKLKNTTLYPDLEWDATLFSGLSKNLDFKIVVYILQLLEYESTITQLHENPIQALLEFYGTEFAHSIINARGVLKGFAETSDPQTGFELIQKKASGKIYDGGKNIMPLYFSTFHVRPWKDDALKPEGATLFPNYKEMFEIHKIKNDHYKWYEFNPGNEENFVNWCNGGAAPSVSLIAEINQLQLLLPDGTIRTQNKNLKDFIQLHNQMITIFSCHLHPSPPHKLGPDNNEIVHFGDAGVSNDFPMYPLTHPNRRIDDVIGFDCSTSVVDHKVFDEQQGFSCDRRVHDFISTNDEFLPPTQKQFALCYLRYLQNDPNFEPAKANSTTRFNFDYTISQVDLMVRLAKAN
ncbi:4276_t:CDS:10, partial [Diversispora eburnea]